MEIIIAVVVFGFGLWWVFLRTPADTKPSAPYKIETPPTPVPAHDVAPQPDRVVVAEGAGVVTSSALTADTVVVAEPAVVAEAPAKKPRKPRAPKVETPAKPAAKKAAPVKKAAVKKPAARTVTKSKKA